MQLNIFNGGLATRLAPHLVQPNESVICRNIDMAVGQLQPVKKKLATDITAVNNPYFFRSKNEWLSSDIPRNYVEFQEVLYWSDGVNTPKQYRETIQELGSRGPTMAPTVNLVNGPAPITKIQLYDWSETIGGVADLQPDGDIPPNTLLRYAIVNNDEELHLSSAHTEFEYVTNGRAGKRTSVIVIQDPNEVKDSVTIYRMYQGVWHFITRVENVEGVGANRILDEWYVCSDDPAEPDDTTDFSDISLNGVYTYAYTFYNSTEGEESKPSPLTSELHLVNGYVELSNLQVSTDPQIDKKRIYRIGNNITEFSLVEEIDNEVTEYTDTKLDSQIIGTPLVSTDNGQAPEGLAGLVEAYALLFGYKGSKVYFSEPAKPYAWPEINFIEFGEPITGLAPVANGLLVFSQYKTYIVTGTGPQTFAQQIISNDQGCISQWSIQRYGSIAIWASTDGLCASSGSEVKVITKEKIGKISFDVHNSILYDETYYLQQANGKTFIADFRFGITFYEYNLGISHLVIANDKLYGTQGETLYELFGSDEYETFEYKSPILIEASYSNNKAYKDFYIKSNGLITVSILIDNVIVLTKELMKDDTHRLVVPQELHRGFSVQFYITGTGTVQEIEYKAYPKQNGK